MANMGKRNIPSSNKELDQVSGSEGIKLNFKDAFDYLQDRVKMHLSVLMTF